MRNFTRKMILAGAFSISLLPVGAQSCDRTINQKPAGIKQTVKNSPRFKKAVNPFDYGTEVVVVTEDFSKFTTGTPDNPDFETVINYKNDDNAWINMLNDFTHMPGWGSHNAYSAGGTLFIQADGKNTQGQVNTPMLNVGQYQGISFISFKARVQEGKPTAKYVLLEAAETYNMAPSWSFLGNTMLPEITSEWQTFEYMFYGGGGYTLFNIVAMDASILVDDVKVYQINQYTGTPTPMKHFNYMGNDDYTAQFDLKWSKVPEADSYILNVYQKDEQGDIVNKLMENVVCTDTVKTVTGAHSGDIYYYTVSSKKGGHVSFPSAEMEIKDVAAPFLKPVGQINDGKYTAEWDSVPAAERFNYISYYQRKAEQNGTFNISDLNLVGLKYNNGKEVEFSTTNPDTHVYDEGTVDGLSQAGWIMKNYAVYKDALTFDAFHYIYNHRDAGMISPEMDLSKNGGKINISLRACAEEGTYWDVNNVEHKGYAQCAIALFTYDAEYGNYVQSELVYPGNVTNVWQDFNCQLTKGTERSIIGFYAVSFPSNLYLASLKIDQDYKTGETFNDPFFYGRWLDKREVEVIIPQKADTKDIYHRVQSVRVKAQDQQSVSRIESDFSTLEYVGVGTYNPTLGIESSKVGFSGATVKFAGDNIVINNPQNESVVIYQTNGSIVYSDNSKSSTITIPVPAHGAYIVKVGKQSIKLTM